ncbi:MAG: allophanate hydrolase [Rhizobiales bacterium]|nr:allophanate hydrolase [Hyphomicrobiales bacterium]
MKGHSFAISALHESYANGVRVEDVIKESLARIEAYADKAVWISRVPEETVLERARALDALSPEKKARLPLFGLPFAIKDNIDLAGLPTTAACPAFAYEPAENAVVVARLMAAGAIPMGKTNLDQFATGLVGTRSPHGAPRSVFNSDYVSGGSSSGSAVSVAAGLVTFALGTDTAGSGRVPAAFNNIVGLKPSRGLLSTRGVVPACRSLDCVSIFALSAEEATTIFNQAACFDVRDAYSRARMPSDPIVPGESFTFAVPRASDLSFFGDGEAERLFSEAIERLESLGGRARRIDFAPFKEVAALLYEGPWVAERMAAVGRFIAEHPKETDPVVAEIILAGANKKAVEAFESFYRLEELRRVVSTLMADIDVLVVPSAPTIYRVDELAKEPVKLNSRLGTYTNFMNLLDMSGIAVPAGIGANGLPFGVTFAGPAFGEARLVELARRFGTALNLAPGAPALNQKIDDASSIEVVVVGAHMSGLPLNHELTSRGAIFLERTKTQSCYRFYALAGGPPFRPGLVRVDEGGGAIEVEIWRMPRVQFGGFMAGIPSPLGIGTLEIAGGRQVKGFICEPSGLAGAEDITALGGWRAYMAQKAKAAKAG